MDRVEKSNMTDRARDRRVKQKKNAAMRAHILIFTAMLAVGFIVSLVVSLRPEVSETENRELEKFPKFTAESLLSGEYFTGIERWYADTFPGRDFFIKTGSKVKTLLTGTQTVKIHGDVSIGDEIPENMPQPDGAVTPVIKGEEPEGGGNEEPEDRPETEPEKTDLGETRSFSAVLLVGDTAYEYYSFVQKTADKYVSAVNSLAGNLAGKARVFDMIVPTSMGITLPDSLAGEITSSDQKKAAEYMYGMMDGTITVDVFDSLRQHRDEYIYFRTDHHWTMLGAWYAYREFCEKAGLMPNELDSYEKREYEGFLGSFYASTEQSPALGENPDTLEVLVPQAGTEVKITDRSGKTFNWFLIADASDYGAGLKYSAIAGGDNPYTIIKNKNISDGSSILVVKESYGNAFVPFLADHYENVHIIDYRYWNGKVSDFVTENGIENVLIINNISATRAGSLMDKLAGIL